MERDEVTGVLYVRAMELCVNVGLMEAAIRMPDRDLPEHVDENWVERLEQLIANLEHATQEVQDFAEAFDDQ